MQGRTHLSLVDLRKQVRTLDVIINDEGDFVRLAELTGADVRDLQEMIPRDASGAAIEGDAAVTFRNMVSAVTRSMQNPDGSRVCEIEGAEDLVGTLGNATLLKLFNGVLQLNGMRGEKEAEGNSETGRGESSPIV